MQYYPVVAPRVFVVSEVHRAQVEILLAVPSTINTSAVGDTSRCRKRSREEVEAEDEAYCESELDKIFSKIPAPLSPPRLWSSIGPGSYIDVEGEYPEELVEEDLVGDEEPKNDGILDQLSKLNIVPDGIPCAARRKIPFHEHKEDGTGFRPINPSLYSSSAPSCGQFLPKVQPCDGPKCKDL